MIMRDFENIDLPGENEQSEQIEENPEYDCDVCAWCGESLSDEPWTLDSHENKIHKTCE
jgi:hypothetical protein